MRSIKLSVIVPAYNEANNIPIVLRRFAEVIDRSDIEVIIVNNGSTDTSAEIIKTLLPQYPFARCVTVPVNQGYGYGILQGLAAARGEFLAWTHVDMQTDPNDVLKALDLVESRGSRADLFVKGSRKGRAWFDQFFTLGMTCFELLWMQRWLPEINAQPNLFHHSFFESWHNPPRDFALDLYVFYLAKVRGLQIIRFPVLFPKRIHGTSSWNTGLLAKWKFIRRTFSFSFALRRSLKNEIDCASD